MNIKFNFEGRKVLVTGGAQGIGLEMAQSFVNSQAEVYVWDYSAPESPMEGVHFSQVDVSDRVACAEAANNISDLDILINNAGITRDKSLSKMSEQEFDEVIGTNLKGVFNVTQALLPCFSAGDSKRIVNLSSIVALYGNFGQSNYVAAKAGVIGLTKTWARELAKKGFTVNAIAPGFTQTAMTEKMPREVLDNMSQAIPVGRMGLPKDIATAAMFFASGEAGYINGAVLSVDGGLVG